MSEFSNTQIIVNVDIAQTPEPEVWTNLEVVSNHLGELVGHDAIQLRRHIAGVEVPKADLLVTPARYVVTPHPDEDPAEKVIYGISADFPHATAIHSEYRNGFVLPFKPKAVETALRAVNKIPAGHRNNPCVGDLYAWGYAGVSMSDTVGPRSLSLIMDGIARLKMPPLTAQVLPAQRKAIQDYLDSACA